MHLLVGADISLILSTLVYVKNRLLDIGKIISLCFCVGLHFLMGSKELTRFALLSFFLMIAVEVFVKY